MEGQARKVFQRLNKNFTNIRVPVRATLAAGSGRSCAISRALYFNARILIMDEPTARARSGETRDGRTADKAAEGRRCRIFLITHDMPDVFALSDRLAVMKNGRLIGTYRTGDRDGGLRYSE
jgi:D-xylose transport system ATP-binding protein